MFLSSSPSMKNGGAKKAPPHPLFAHKRDCDRYSK